MDNMKLNPCPAAWRSPLQRLHERLEPTFTANEHMPS